MRVLIVDDSRSSLAFLGRLVKELDYCEVECLLSPLAALERSREQDFDLVLVDHVMPEMDGILLIEKIREGGPHERALSFVAVHRESVIASVRMTWIAAGKGRALLLGPLAVRPTFKSIGIGRKLVHVAVEAAREAGAGAVLLVGDAPYYGPLGFEMISHGRIAMPRPVDPNRLLAVELQPGAVARLEGDVTHAALATKI